MTTGFQRIAIAVSDMDKAYQRLPSTKSTAHLLPQRLPDWNKAAAVALSTSGQTVITWKLLTFREKAIQSGSALLINLFLS